MDILRYYNPGTARIELPPGYYFDIPPLNDEGVTVVSAEPGRPAVLDQLTIFAPGCGVENVLFPEHCDALALRGENNYVKNCEFINNETAILAERKCWILNNLIVGFTQDGIRFCGDRTEIENNQIGRLRLLPGADPAHHDCIQGWAGDPDSPFRSAGRYDAQHSLEGAVIRHNLLFDHPESQLQGITFFDGLGFGWEVTNNKILLNGPHALTLLGQRSPAVHSNQFVGDGKAVLGPARRWVAQARSWETVLV